MTYKMQSDWNHEREQYHRAWAKQLRVYAYEHDILRGKKDKIHKLIKVVLVVTGAFVIASLSLNLQEEITPLAYRITLFIGAFLSEAIGTVSATQLYDFNQITEEHKAAAHFYANKADKLTSNLERPVKQRKSFCAYTQRVMTKIKDYESMRNVPSISSRFVVEPQITHSATSSECDPPTRSSSSDLSSVHEKTMYGEYVRASPMMTDTVPVDDESVSTNITWNLRKGGRRVTNVQEFEQELDTHLQRVCKRTSTSVNNV